MKFFLHHYLKRGAITVGVETISERQAAAEKALRAAGAEDVQGLTKKKAVADAEQL
jgi:hypothetical protein